MALGTTGLVVTAALVAGAVGAGAAVAVVEGTRPSAAPPAASADAERIASLEERLSKQDRELADLRARVEEGAHARPFAPPPPRHGPGPDGMPGAAPGESGGEQIAMPAPGEPPAGGANMSPEEREKFQAYYREMREQEQEKARKTRQAAFEAQLRGRIDRLPAELSMTQEQKDAAVKILLERAERMRTAFAEMPQGGGPDARKAMQEKAEAIREESRTQLQQALTVDQAKAVEAMASREGIGASGSGSRPGVRRGEPGVLGTGRRRGAAGGGEAPAPQPPMPPR